MCSEDGEGVTIGGEIRFEPLPNTGLLESSVAGARRRVAGAESCSAGVGLVGIERMLAGFVWGTGVGGMF